MSQFAYLNSRLRVAERLIEALKNHIKAIGGNEFFERQVTELETSLEEASKEKLFRIAVVGSFKVGKSSFINRLFELDGLAPVSTNPETASVTSFRYSNRAVATVRFISATMWSEMTALHKTDPLNPRVQRLRGWGRKLKDLEDRNERMNLISEFKTFIQKDGYQRLLECGDWKNKVERKAFHAELKKFISSNSPRHYLVERVEIEAPIELLKSGIEFIDTPGLNDTDMYRVEATEKEVEHIDAILFLTLSGSSFSQTDKEFLLSQIRKRRVQALRLLVTKFDQTFEAACSYAEENGDETPVVENHILEEKLRVQRALEDTIREVVDSARGELTNTDKEYFVNLVNGIEIHFISSKLYYEGQHEKSGIPRVRDDLKKLIQSASWAKSAAEKLDRVMKGVVGRIETYRKSYISKKNSIFDQEAEDKAYIETQQLAEKSIRRFEKLLESEISGAKIWGKFDRETIKSKIKMVGVRAQDVINEYQRQDQKLHWATKRVGTWFYLPQFSISVANRIFPDYEVVIRHYQDRILASLKAGRAFANELANTLKNSKSVNEIVNAQMLDLGNDFARRINFDPSDVDALLEYERVIIVSQLQNFLDPQTDELINQARVKVAQIWGQGTSDTQNKAIEAFYHEFSMIIRPKLEKYLFDTFERYTELVADRIIEIYKKIITELEIRLIDERNVIKEILQRQQQREIDVITPALDELDAQIVKILGSVDVAA